MKFNVMDRQEMMVVDVGVPADWVKVNVQRTVRFSLPFLINNGVFAIS